MEGFQASLPAPFRLWRSFFVSSLRQELSYYLFIEVRPSFFVINHLPPYLTRIEGPPPKRDVVRSSRAGGAKKAPQSFYRLRRFFLFTISKGCGNVPHPFINNNHRRNRQAISVAGLFPAAAAIEILLFQLGGFAHYAGKVLRVASLEHCPEGGQVVNQ